MRDDNEWHIAVASYQNKGDFGPFGNIQTFNDAFVVSFDQPTLVFDAIKGDRWVILEPLGCFRDYNEAIRLTRIFKRVCDNAVKGHFEREAWDEFNEKIDA